MAPRSCELSSFVHVQTSSIGLPVADRPIAASGSRAGPRPGGLRRGSIMIMMHTTQIQRRPPRAAS
jgi:hypothetical protein